MRRLLLVLGLGALVAAHDHALSNHRKRLDELEGRVDNFRRGLQTERRLMDQINDDFDLLLVSTIPWWNSARQWHKLLETRPGVVEARRNLAAAIVKAREQREASE